MISLPPSSAISTTRARCEYIARARTSSTLAALVLLEICPITYVSFSVLVGAYFKHSSSEVSKMLLQAPGRL